MTPPSIEPAQQTAAKVVGLIMVWPDLETVAIPLDFMPLALFEIATGIWLLVRGIRTPGCVAS